MEFGQHTSISKYDVPDRALLEATFALLAALVLAGGQDRLRADTERHCRGRPDAGRRGGLEHKP